VGKFTKVVRVCADRPWSGPRFPKVWETLLCSVKQTISDGEEVVTISVLARLEKYVSKPTAILARTFKSVALHAADDCTIHSTSQVWSSVLNTGCTHFQDCISKKSENSYLTICCRQLRQHPFHRVLELATQNPNNYAIEIGNTRNYLFFFKVSIINWVTLGTRCRV
jgi:hypothetical protein